MCEVTHKVTVWGVMLFLHHHRDRTERRPAKKREPSQSTASLPVGAFPCQHMKGQKVCSPHLRSAMWAQQQKDFRGRNRAETPSIKANKSETEVMPRVERPDWSHRLLWADRSNKRRSGCRVRCDLSSALTSVQFLGTSGCRHGRSNLIVIRASQGKNRRALVLEIITGAWPCWLPGALPQP